VHFAACAFLPRKPDHATCQTPATYSFVIAPGIPARHTLMKKFKLKKPSGPALTLILLSLLCATIYSAIAVGLATQIGKPPGIVHGATADD
jgi:hypothetical protein